MRIATSKQMKEIERRADESGLSYYQMMENAGAAAAEVVKSTENFNEKVILICAGTGNNGGDGYVVARLLKESGAMTFIMTSDGAPKTDCALTNFNKARDMNIEIVQFDPKTSLPLILGADIIIDAIYGTGFHGELKSEIRAFTKMINESDAIKIALDLPSGVNADTGEFDPDAVKADTTIAFDSFKPAHMSDKALSHIGRPILKDIGIPDDCHDITVDR